MAESPSSRRRAEWTTAASWRECGRTTCTATDTSNGSAPTKWSGASARPMECAGECTRWSRACEVSCSFLLDDLQLKESIAKGRVLDYALALDNKIMVKHCAGWAKGMLWAGCNEQDGQPLMGPAFFGLTSRRPFRRSLQTRWSS